MSDQVPTGERAQLVAMLRQASEVEHALTCQYLYAAFSLRFSDPGLTPSQNVLVAHWNQQITKIAAQEMYHLMLASNLLTSIGEEPYLDRENFPQPAKHFSEIALPSMLSAFDAATVHRFLCWEKPEEQGWWDAKCAECATATSEVLGFPLLTPEQATYSTIGQLYGLIDDALKANPTWIDPANAARQVTSAIVPFSPPVAPIVSYADAHQHIEEIVREGEGTADHNSQAHFAFFHQIYDEFTRTPFTPAWPTVHNPSYDEALAAPGSTLIVADDDPVAAALGALFNDAYLLLLQTLGRLFLVRDETDEQRQTLANAAMAFMPLVIKELGRVLVTIPLSGQNTGLYAGPSFELPQPLPLPAGDSLAAWGGLYEDMARLTSRARILTVQHGVDGLEKVAAHLETLLPLFVLDAAAVR